jgi:tRNA(Ile)-lysidine synthase
VSASSRLRLRIAEVVAERRLWAPGDRVAVAVSGGPDSMALLDLLVAGAGLHGGVLSVVTVDHRQHPDSAAHAAFVGAHAAARGLPFTAVCADLAPGASEATLRDARFQAFEALAVDRVALAHHRDDQAETVLLALVRGSGSAGRAAMAWRRGRYVRPALGVSRDELRSWLDLRGVPSIDDPSNDDVRFRRNLIRRDVLPVLERARPGAVAAIARAAGHAADDEDILSALVAESPEASDPCGLPTPFVADGPAALVRRALLRALPGAAAAHLDAIRLAARRGGGRVHLPGGVAVSIEPERVVVARALAPSMVIDDPDGYGDPSRNLEPGPPES